MENTTRLEAVQTSDRDALFLASCILLDVRRMIASIHVIVVFLIRYVMLGVSITNGLVGLIVPSVVAESSNWDISIEESN